MVKSRSQASTWLRGDLAMETAPRRCDVIPIYHTARFARRRRTPRSNRAPARANPRSISGGLARATPRKWPGLKPLLTHDGLLDDWRRGLTGHAVG
jgi:hypothetical protein